MSAWGDTLTEHLAHDILMDQQHRRGAVFSTLVEPQRSIRRIHPGHRGRRGRWEGALEGQTAEPSRAGTGQRVALTRLAFTAAVLGLLVPVLTEACPAPVGIQECIRGGGSVGYSPTVQGPACHGGSADGCPVSMVPIGPGF